MNVPGLTSTKLSALHESANMWAMELEFSIIPDERVRGDHQGADAHQEELDDLNEALEISWAALGPHWTSDSEVRS